jgi:hypothetical protein
MSSVNTKFLLFSALAGVMSIVIIKILDPEILDFKQKFRKESSNIAQTVKGSEVL